MILQESPPTLRRRLSAPDHVFGDRCLGYLDAKFQHFPVNPRCAPKRIGQAHSPDKPLTLGSSTGLPLLLHFQAQWRRKPSRCHRITVSGLTIWSASRHLGHNLGTSTQKDRSDADNRGRAPFSFKTASCWRNTRFSNARSRRDRNNETKVFRRTGNHLVIDGS